MRCPPPRPISPSRASRATAAPRSTPPTERPEPLPSPPSKPITTAGRPKASLSRAATIPTTPGCQPSPAAQTSGPSAPRPPPAPRRHPHRRLDLPPLGVQRVQPRRQRRRLVRVVGGEEPRPEVGDADPPAGVDPRPEHEAEPVGASAPPVIPAASASAAIPGRARRAITVSPCRTSARLSPTSGATSATVASATRSRKPRRSGPATPSAPHQPVDRDQHQEDHPRGAEIAELAVLVLPVRVHHRQRRRQRLAAEVVVEHDHVAARGGDRLVAERAAVDADDQVVRRPEPLHRRHVRPVALVDAVGNVERRAPPKPPQPGQHQRRRGAAVDVVVGEDRDPLARLRRRPEARRGLVHVASRDGSGIRSRSAGAR